MGGGEGVRVILERVKELSEGLGVIVRGDFNGEGEWDVMKEMRDGEKRKDVEDRGVMCGIVYGG